eukprot:641767-Amorphochlora_amoeboformis.AAC.1
MKHAQAKVYQVVLAGSIESTFQHHPFAGLLRGICRTAGNLGARVRVFSQATAGGAAAEVSGKIVDVSDSWGWCGRFPEHVSFAVQNTHFSRSCSSVFDQLDTTNYTKDRIATIFLL